jgi:hypothetical protein
MLSAASKVRLCIRNFISTYNMSQMLLAQVERDDSIRELLRKLGDVYKFLAEKQDKLRNIQSMNAVFGKLVQQTVECADFVSRYSETKIFCEYSTINILPRFMDMHSHIHVGHRLSKNIIAETDNVIKKYNSVLDDLMQQFRDIAMRDVVLVVQEVELVVHHIGKETFMHDWIFTDCLSS